MVSSIIVAHSVIPRSIFGIIGRITDYREDIFHHAITVRWLTPFPNLVLPSQCGATAERNAAFTLGFYFGVISE